MLHRDERKLYAMKKYWVVMLFDIVHDVTLEYHIISTMLFPLHGQQYVCIRKSLHRLAQDRSVTN